MSVDLDTILLKQPILLFDGECGFCNKSVQFFLKREKKSGSKKMYFAPLQSEVGQALIKYFEIDSNTESLVLIKDHSAYIKSCAALRLTPYIKSLWPLMMGLVIIPPFLRNIVYDFIANRRMKWFGRIENCALLQQEDKERFLAF